MIFRRIAHEDLGCASYLVGDDSAGVAAVIDPKLEVEEYTRLAAYLGVSIEHILETHNHADHVSGHGRLAAATGAAIHIHRDADVQYDHEPFDEGWELELGAVRVRALHTPGHRPEHVAFALSDTGRGDEPCMVLTGDSLFVGDVARPDLAIDREEGARQIFHSLRELVSELPRETEVWPAHVGGSLCGGADMDMRISSTLAYERAHNALLGERDETHFAERLIGGLGPQPPNFRRIVELNRGPLITELLELSALTAHELDARHSSGALVVDVRDDVEFDEAHIRGALLIPARKAGFGTRLAWLADPDQEIVLVGRDSEEAAQAARLAQAVGIASLGGVLAGGMSEWREQRRPVAEIERLALDRLPQRLEEDPLLQMLDVREEDERRRGFIPGSAFEPWHDLRGVPGGLDGAQPIAVLCSSGERAAVAASVLQRDGARDPIHVVDGGVPRWEELGRPVERPR